MNFDKGPALLVLAAGLGRRYGGFKQLDAIGAGNETIMDLSISDAIAAGFHQVVLVVNRTISEQIQEQIISKYQKSVDIRCVYQELDSLPPGFSVSGQRSKPWGTAHAILSAKGLLTSPFAVINADDFYGATAFPQIKKELAAFVPASTEYCMLGYHLSNTLSSHGGVSRGLCSVDGEFLSSLREISNIRETDQIISGDFQGKRVHLAPDSVVSMNFWGFTPTVFKLLEDRFISFLTVHEESPTAEFYITDALDYAISNGLARVKVLTTSERWFGVTFREDRDEVRKGIRDYRRQ